MRWDQMPSISEPAPNALAKVGFWSEDRLGQDACYIPRGHGRFAGLW